MRKFCKFVCSLALCLSLAACSSGNGIDDDAIQAVIDAGSKLSELNSASYEMGIKANVEGEDVDASLHGDFINSDAPEMSMIIDVTSQGQKVEKLVEMYMTDQTMYFSFMGMKQKSPVDDTVEEQLPTKKNSGSITVDMIKPYLKSASKSGDTIKMEIDTEKVVDSAKEAMKDATIDSLTLEIKLTDGFISNIDVVADITSKGQKASLNGTFKLENLNGVTTIDFPDFSTYVESTDSLLQ